MALTFLFNRGHIIKDNACRVPLLVVIFLSYCFHGSGGFTLTLYVCLSDIIRLPQNADVSYKQMFVKLSFVGSSPSLTMVPKIKSS